MNKKKYMRPETCLYVIIEKQTILAGTTLVEAANSDYSDENVEEYWDEDKGIWGD